MTIHSDIIDSIKSAGSDYFLSVPCKLLAEMIEVLEADDGVDYMPCTREEEGMGLSAGAALAGRLPTILMQDTGIGNSVNALTTLNKYYNLPLIMVISYRGTPGEPVGAQGGMAIITEELLQTMRIPLLKCHRKEDIADIAAMANHAKVIEGPVAISLDFNLMGGN